MLQYFLDSPNLLSKFKFHWQGGYGAFSYAHSQKDQVIKYVMNQEKLHEKKTFREEYLELLNRFEIKARIISHLSEVPGFLG